MIKLNYILACMAIVAISFACNHETGHKRSNNFTGLWKLHSIESKDSITGKWGKYKNENQGYLLYDNKDNMSVHITSKGYEKSGYSLPFGVDSVSLEALKHRTKSATYFAKYKVSEENQTINHARISHSDPSEWNVTVTRKYTFKGDTLILEPLETKYSGLRLIWIKEPESNNK